MFVKSKSGEIDRRVRHCEKLINSIAEKDEQRQLKHRELDSPVTGSPSLQPKKSSISDKSRHKLVFLLKQEIVQLTRDVQRLARFIGVQRTGFRKLLKKYKKWSQSSQLSDMFLPILESPSSFTNQDFTAVFLELSLLYDILRQAKSSNYISRTAPSQYPNNETLCKFDCEMITSVSNSTVFWVHPDNVVEIKVALLRNLGLVSDDAASAATLQKSSSSTSVNFSSSNSPQNNSSGNQELGDCDRAKESQKDLSFAIYLDNTKKFNSIQTHSEPGQIRWVHGTSSPEPDQNSSHILCSPVGGLRHFCLASLSQSQSDLILSGQFDGLGKEISSEKNNLSKLALSWVERRKAAPISKASFKRSRFRFINPKQSSTNTNSSIENSHENDSNIFSTSPTSNMSASDIWATLDTNVCILKTKTKDSSLTYDAIDPDENSSDLINFPYAVLEVRYKEMDKPTWLAELEESHLVYPVEGFSLYAHSVATFYSDSLSQLPSWLSVLNGEVDIRKTPKKHGSNNNQIHNNNAATNNNTNTPVSGILLNSSNERESLLARNGHTTKYVLDSEPKSVIPEQDTTQPVVRYWNEFDDPEDGPEDGVFVIIPDDDDEHSGVFSDHNIVQLFNLSENFVTKAHMLKHKVAKFFGLGNQHQRGDNYDSDDEDADSYNSYDEDSDEYYYYNSQRGLPTIYEDAESDDYAQERYYLPDEIENGSNYSSGSMNDNYQNNQNRISSDPENDMDYYSFPGKYSQEYPVSEQRDYILSILYTLFFSLGFLIVALLSGLIFGNDLGEVSPLVFGFIVTGLVISLVISLFAIYLYFLRSKVPGLIHQSLVYITFFVIMSVSIGGIVLLIL